MTYEVIVIIEALLPLIAFCCSGYVHNCEISAGVVCNLCHIIELRTQNSETLFRYIGS